jgi:hypothetical protein
MNTIFIYLFFLKKKGKIPFSPIFWCYQSLNFKRFILALTTILPTKFDDVVHEILHFNKNFVNKMTLKNLKDKNNTSVNIRTKKKKKH